MKKYYIIFLTSALLLSSCSIDWNDEKGGKITELEKQIAEMKKEKEDDLFKKKQECEKYRDKIELMEINKKSVFKEIFYSKKYNSCLYIVTSNNDITITLKDVLTNKLIQSRLILKPSDLIEFESQIKELK